MASSLVSMCYFSYKHGPRNLTKIPGLLLFVGAVSVPASRRLTQVSSTTDRSGCTLWHSPSFLSGWSVTFGPRHVNIPPYSQKALILTLVYSRIARGCRSTIAFLYSQGERYSGYPGGSGVGVVRKELSKCSVGIYIFRIFVVFPR